MVMLSELLDNKKLKILNLVAGQAGISRIVSGAIMLDNPEMVNWMREGEMLLTTGFLLKDNPMMQEQLITNLAQSNAGGLVVKLKRYFDTTPRAMLKKADELDFPLFELPYYMSLSELSEIINKCVYFSEKNIKDSERNISEALFKIIEGNGNMKAILELSKSYTSNAYALLDVNMRTLYVSSNFSRYINLSPVIGKLLFPPATTRSYIDRINHNMDPIDISIDSDIPSASLSATIYPIQSEGEFLGYLLSAPGTYDSSVAEIDVIHKKIIFALSILLLKERSCSIYRNRQSNIILEKLLFNEVLTSSEIERISTKYNFPINDNYVCCIVCFSKIREIEFSSNWVGCRTLEYDHIISCWNTHSDGNCKLYPLKNNLIVILQLKDTSNSTLDTIKNFCHDLQMLLTRNGLNKDILIGIGGIVSGLTNLHSSYYHATRVIDIMAKTNRETIGVFEDYIIYELINNAPYIHDVLKEKLLPLIDYDQNHNAELLLTLETYLSNGQNSIQTSKSLFIHRNTLLYRLNQIKEIINIDFKNTDEILIYQLALKALSI